MTKVKFLFLLQILLALFLASGCDCGSGGSSGDDDIQADDDIVTDDTTDDTSDDTTDDTGDDTETTPPETTAEPAGGWYGEPTDVTLTSIDDYTLNPTIYYTLDGSNPEPGQPSTYSAVSPLTLYSMFTDTTLKFFAIDDCNNREATKTELYRFDEGIPVCTADPLPGNFSGPYAPLGIEPLTVTVTCTDDSGVAPTVYYTTDGTLPTAESTSAIGSVSIEVPRTMRLRFYAVDQFGNQCGVKTQNYSIYWWDDFEDWPEGTEPDTPYLIMHDPWEGTVPMVQPLAAGGQVLQIIDVNYCSDGVQDTWGTAKYREGLSLPDVIGYQTYMRLRAGSVAGWGTYFKGPTNEPWRLIVWFQNGNIEAWDQSLNGGEGAFTVCLSPVVIDQWYFMNVVHDRFGGTYTVEIDDMPTGCTDLPVHYDFELDPGLASDVTGAKFTTNGDTVGTVEFDNYRVYIP